MDRRLAKLSPKTFVPGTASTVMLMLMSSVKLLVKIWAAATQAALAAAASAPKFVSKLAVNVGVMTRRVSLAELLGRVDWTWSSDPGREAVYRSHFGPRGPRRGRLGCAWSNDSGGET